MRLGLQASPIGSYITINAYEYQSYANLVRSDLRVRMGNLYTYIQNKSHTKVDLSFTMMGITDVLTVNSWFSSQSNLRFYENDSPQIADGTYLADGSIRADGGAGDAFNVRFMGNVEPSRKFNQHYFNEYLMGEMSLETYI